MNTLKNKKFLLFSGGVIMGLILPPVIKSQIVCKAAVSILAKGLELKDSARETITLLHNDAIGL